MRHPILAALAAALLTAAPAMAAGPPTPPAVYTDPPADAAHPARSQVLHIPSGDVRINGLAYVAAGPGPHPTLVLMHGLPGNEKNLDLAQAVRRAGWTVVTFNYRGSWGSPGDFRFAGALDDAAAVLAYLRDPANAQALQVDPGRIVVAGHSMGGWAAALTGARDKGVRATVLISAADMGASAKMPTKDREAMMADNMETLAGVTAKSMSDEVAAHAAAFSLLAAAPGLADRPLLVLSAEDGLAPETDALASAVRAQGGTRVAMVHAATDHSWNGKRVQLQSEVITWLASLP
ncbi:MAG: alpha/beta hydrolase [Caulobacter sp.]|nr:alpha/beta hydrolase [Caulobacter sp.]